MTEPVKVTAPMKTPRKVSTRRIESSTASLWARMAAKPVRVALAASSMARTRAASMSALKPMKTAARPTSECMAATSCGISVIWTRLAATAPSTPPRATRITESTVKNVPEALCPISVATTAKAMPAMPYQTARLALSWPESPPSERMKRTAATT